MASEFETFFRNTDDLARGDYSPGQAVPEYQPAYTRGLVTLTGADLLSRQFAPRELILSPWLPTKGLAMIYAERGIGKTWVALNIAYAVASGGSFLRWQAPGLRTVAYIDGEMPAGDLQQRLRSIVLQSPLEAPDGGLRFIAADLQADGLPDLADAAGQQFYEKAIQGAGLIIVDNLSTVCRSLRENEADSWGPVQSWCLRQRAAGRSVLLIHHAGKSGGQRGTSRKEDVLDSVISLRRPPDYGASQGARFEIHFTKSRGFYGDEAAAFEARLAGEEWQTAEIARDDDEATLRALQAQGMTVREIAAETGLSKSAVARRLQGGA